MGTEIERKFLVKNDLWRGQAEGAIPLCQGYLARSPDATVRVRIAGKDAWLTVKGRNEGCTRAEFEYAIPLAEAREILDRVALHPCIEKTRYLVRCGGHLWEVDLFAGENEGLIIAEIELGSEQEPFERPEWVGEEVTGDPRYYNSNLIDHPYLRW